MEQSLRNLNKIRTEFEKIKKRQKITLLELISKVGDKLDHFEYGFSNYFLNILVEKLIKMLKISPV